MKIQTTLIFDFDDQAEEARICKCFRKNPEKMNRHLAILNAFRNGDREKFYQLCENLPYDDENEYHEVENVCCFMMDIMRNGDSSFIDPKISNASLEKVRVEFHSEKE